MKLKLPLLTILHVVDSLEVGGLERIVTDLAIAQHRRGHKVIVFSINSTGGFLGELQSAGISVVIGAKSKSLDRDVLLTLRRVATENGVAVVHAHNFVPNYYAAAALFGARVRTALVCTCHDMGSRLTNRRLRWMFRLSLLRTRRVAMVGRQVYERYMSAGWVKADVAQTVLNGIPVERFAPSEERRRAARSALGIAEGVPVIGSVGRLVTLKNQALMLEILPQLLKAHPQLRYVLVGDGPLDATLRAQAASLGVADRVDFLGQRSDIADLLPGFDIFALPSLTEGLSIALLEACASGLAVVTTKVGGNPEIVEHGETGLLVPVADGDALRDALDGLLRDVDLRQRLGSQARAWVTAHASIDALCDAYDAFYRSAM